MKERLVIKNFGPIESVDLKLGKMTILIGEQATGKSTIAKVLAVCRYFSYIVDFRTDKSISDNSFYRGLLYWNINEFLNVDTVIEYENSDYSVEITNKFEENSTFSIESEIFLNPKSDKFKKLLSDLALIKEEPKVKDGYSFPNSWSPNENFFRLNVRKVLDNPLYIPTERGLQSIFSLGKSSIQNISDSLFDQFAKIDKFNGNFQSETEIKPLDLIYKSENGQGFIKNKRQVEFSKLKNGANGYQSTIPVVLAVKHYTEFERKSKTFIIEEPELNLFPKAQKKLMEFFVENINNNGHSFLLPTHSPYFLSAINDLLLAYKKGQKNQIEVEKVIKKEFWLNPKDLSVYELKDGKHFNIFDIFDKKTGLILEDLLIADNIIDEVSDEMNDEFDELLSIR